MSTFKRDESRIVVPVGVEVYEGDKAWNKSGNRVFLNTTQDYKAIYEPNLQELDEAIKTWQKKELSDSLNHLREWLPEEGIFRAFKPRYRKGRKLALGYSLELKNSFTRKMGWNCNQIARQSKEDQNELLNKIDFDSVEEFNSACNTFRNIPYYYPSSLADLMQAVFTESQIKNARWKNEISPTKIVSLFFYIALNYRWVLFPAPYVKFKGLRKSGLRRLALGGAINSSLYRHECYASIPNINEITYKTSLLTGVTLIMSTDARSKEDYSARVLEKTGRIQHSAPFVKFWQEVNGREFPIAHASDPQKHEDLHEAWLQEHILNKYSTAGEMEIWVESFRGFSKRIDRSGMSQYRNFISWVFNNSIKPSEVTRDVFLDYRKFRNSDPKLSPYSVNSYLRRTKQLLEYTGQEFKLPNLYELLLEIDLPRLEQPTRTHRSAMPEQEFLALKRILIKWENGIPSWNTDSWVIDGKRIGPIWLKSVWNKKTQTYDNNVINTVALSHIVLVLTYGSREEQTSLLDSGELDEFIPDVNSINYIDRRVKFIKNPLGKKGRQKGALQRYSQGDLSFQFSTDKVRQGSRKPEERMVHFMPKEALFALIELIKFQQTYGTDPKIVDAQKKANQRKVSIVPLFRKPGHDKPAGRGLFDGIQGWVMALAQLYYGFENLVQIKRHKSFSSLGFNEAIRSNYLDPFKPSYDTHSMRVTVLTLLRRGGLEFDELMHIAGHVTLAMAVYYQDKDADLIRENIEAVYNSSAIFSSENPDDVIQHIKTMAEENREALWFDDADAVKSFADRIPTEVISLAEGICCGSLSYAGSNDLAGKPLSHAAAENCMHCKYFVTSIGHLPGLVFEFNKSLARARKAVMQVAEHKNKRNILPDSAQNERKKLTGKIVDLDRKVTSSIDDVLRRLVIIESLQRMKEDKDKRDSYLAVGVSNLQVNERAMTYFELLTTNSITAEIVPMVRDDFTQDQIDELKLALLKFLHKQGSKEDVHHFLFAEDQFKEHFLKLQNHIAEILVVLGRKQGWITDGKFESILNGDLLLRDVNGGEELLKVIQGLVSNPKKLDHVEKSNVGYLINGKSK